MIINSFILGTVADVSTLLEMGYIGNMNEQDGNLLDYQEAFNGITSDSALDGAFSVSTSSDGELGYNYSWEYAAGKKIEKVVVYASNNHGYITGSDPSDMVLYLEGWDGSWNALGNTGTFTDANSLVKTITSSDQATLFTRIRVLVETATTAIRNITELEIHEVTAGQLVLNSIETNMSRTGKGKLMQAFDGVTVAVLSDSVQQINSVTTDSEHGVAFHTPYKIEKAILYSSSDQGFFALSNPTDMQIDLEGWNGSSWDAIGDTGTFTDANSISKTITSTDQTTLFEKVRVLISTASSQRRILAEAEYFVLRPA